ncbi:MAG: peptidylprolyl isomerase [Deltaproteobacteria bacterium]|nr:peptidylprolyl isomerase [Deltaproteobacteria bacterium]
MSIVKDSAAAIVYKLTIAGGVVVDANTKEEPLWYLQGHGNLIPGLENELLGMSAGDTKKVVVQAADGYGVKDPEKRIQVPKVQFPPDTTFELGDHVEANEGDGQGSARIVGIGSKEITLDFNHELAGKVLTFDVEVLEVREATEEELAHGHVHGPGAHQH